MAFIAKFQVACSLAQAFLRAYELNAASILSYWEYVQFFYLLGAKNNVLCFFIMSWPVIRVVMSYLLLMFIFLITI